MRASIAFVLLPLAVSAQITQIPDGQLQAPGPGSPAVTSTLLPLPSSCLKPPCIPRHETVYPPVLTQTY